MNTLLSERLQTIEKQCWANAQYSRRECLEISGIPLSVSDNDLEDVFRHDKDIEDFHRVGKRVQPLLTFAKGRCQSKV